MAFAELHRALFVEFPSSACAALAATPCGGSVAVGREDGSVELYDAADWRCVLRAPGCEGASLTSLVWVERDGAPPSLLSAGLTGQLLLWGLAHLRPLSATDSGGGPVWALAARPHAVGDEPARAHRSRPARRPR